MLNRDAFLESVAKETEICKHLATKIEDAGLTYTPGENMRETLDLMRYLTFAGAASADALVSKDWSVVGPYQEKASTMPAAEFPARMDAQLERIRDLVNSVPEAELETRDVPLPWGVDVKLGQGLVDTTLKFLASYRLQLFCYAKAAGARDLSTYNAWLGMDKPAE